MEAGQEVGHQHLQGVGHRPLQGEATHKPLHQPLEGQDQAVGEWAIQARPHRNQFKMVTRTSKAQKVPQNQAHVVFCDK
ncbi:hypothetical protein DPMN_069052, partial [Dreissena polymorpha]